MTFDMDPAEPIPPGSSLHDMAMEAVRAGTPREGGCSSVQGDMCLCDKCTSIVDRYVTEDRNATADEVNAALNKKAGV
ncbi:hypothetical protein [Mesorhizobium sp.]|uniref:hypothetical protein n=1 Tax=Mesorhizobium sp. TaxID=1871066 RepID=UPI00122BE182|nr:hypothetical protein [Mesorhizobium sp.]TIX28797.1 MAG: hypothetical protein E5V35_00105 [Mesorhizobium sp.]